MTIPTVPILLLVITTAGAGSVSLDQGWEELHFPRKPDNSFSLHDGALRVVSDDSVSMIHHHLDPIDLAATPILAWRWRVDLGFPATDLAAKGADDRPLVLFVAFPWDPAVATTWERLTRPIIELFEGAEAPGRAIAYTWGGTAPRGTWVPSPHMHTAGGILVLRPGDTPCGTWQTERVDLAADYESFFGAPAPAPSHIAIGADTDDTDARSDGRITDLRFEAR